MRATRFVMSSLGALLLPLCLTACGDNGGDPADAATIDGTPTIDAATPDAAPDATPQPAPVTVWVHDGEVGLPGLRVLFLDTDDSVIADTVTDASGEATADVPFDGQALVVSANGNYVALWQGLSAGRLEMLVDGTYETKTVIAPTHTQTDGGYEVQTPCGGGSGSTPTVLMQFYRRGCTTGDLLVTWRYGTGPAQALHATGQDIAPNTTLDLSGLSFTPMVSRTFTFENLEAADQTILSFDVWYGADGLGFVGQGPANNIITDSGDQPLTGNVPNTPSARLLATVGQYRGTGAREVIRRGPFADSTFDPTGLWLPDLGPAAYADVTRTISWSESGGSPGVQPTAVRIGASFDLPGDPNVGNDVYWEIIARPNTEVRIPRLPASYADVDPAGATNPFPIGVQSLAVPGGYAAYRDRAYSRAGWYLLDRDGVGVRSVNRDSL